MFGKESVIDTTANKANRNKAIIIPMGDGKLFKKQNIFVVMIMRLILKNIYIVITILILNTIDFLTK